MPTSSRKVRAEWGHLALLLTYARPAYEAKVVSERVRAVLCGPHDRPRFGGALSSKDNRLPLLKLTILHPSKSGLEWALPVCQFCLLGHQGGKHTLIPTQSSMASVKTDDIQKNGYTIQRFPAISIPLEAHLYIFRFSNFTTWSLWVVYVSCQFLSAGSIQMAKSRILWRMCTCLVAEFLLSFQEVVTALSLILGLIGSVGTIPRPRYRLTGESAPSIDILVTCCGEPIEIIVNTVKAAASQDYPSKQFRVFLLDDAHSEKLQLAIKALNLFLAKMQRPCVTYLSRNIQPGTRSYFKAGNLRFGIHESNLLGGSEFIAGLDADMIPDRLWLRKMVPHLILDDRLGLACSPQVIFCMECVEIRVADPSASNITTFLSAILWVSKQISTCTSRSRKS